MWEEISTIAGVISAVCAVVSIRGLAIPQEVDTTVAEGRPVISHRMLLSFLLACSGWCLVVLSYLWIFKPYGSYIRRDEYVQIGGIIVALPAFIIFVSGMRYIVNGKPDSK